MTQAPSEKLSPSERSSGGSATLIIVASPACIAVATISATVAMRRSERLIRAGAWVIIKTIACLGGASAQLTRPARLFGSPAIHSQPFIVFKLNAAYRSRSRPVRADRVGGQGRVR